MARGAKPGNKNAAGPHKDSYMGGAAYGALSQGTRGARFSGAMSGLHRGPSHQSGTVAGARFRGAVGGGVAGAIGGATAGTLVGTQLGNTTAGLAIGTGVGATLGGVAQGHRRASHARQGVAFGKSLHTRNMTDISAINNDVKTFAEGGLTGSRGLPVYRNKK